MPRKFLNFCPEKKQSPREKIWKCARETSNCPRKFFNLGLKKKTLPLLQSAHFLIEVVHFQGWGGEGGHRSKFNWTLPYLQRRTGVVGTGGIAVKPNHIRVDVNAKPHRVDVECSPNQKKQVVSMDTMDVDLPDVPVHSKKTEKRLNFVD